MELIRQEDIGEARIIVASGNELQTVEGWGDLSPKSGTVLDFVITPSGPVLVVCDDLISIDVAEKLKGRFATPEEIGIKTDSWIFPLVAHNLFNRSQKLDDADDALRFAGGYLEAHVRMEEMSLWQRGLVLATVRANFERLKEMGLVEGESHWGWFRLHAYNENGDSLEKAQKRFGSYIRAADVMLRNVEKREWIARLTMGEIVAIPISKVIRCCGLIGEGVFDVSPELRMALLNPAITNSDMDTLLRKARAHQDEIPERVVDKETGEISWIDRETREETTSPTDGMIDEYLPRAGLLSDEVVASPKGGAIWTYDWERKTFGFWENGEWNPGLSAVNDNERVRKFIDLIIANCDVRADYDMRGVT